MKPNWAEENLQTIRTLMERSALYRRALAPIMLFVGGLGLIAMIGALYFHFESNRMFAAFWFGVACIALTGTFLLIRKQSLKEQEAFWSPPTRRVGVALMPPFCCGLLVGLLMALLPANWQITFPMALVWVLFYGCALHSAGFFMARGIKWLGWAFILGAILLLILMTIFNWSVQPYSGNLVMGGFFGGAHVLYGFYLYLTEKKTSAA